MTTDRWLTIAVVLGVFTLAPTFYIPYVSDQVFYHVSPLNLGAHHKPQGQHCSPFQPPLFLS